MRACSRSSGTSLTTTTIRARQNLAHLMTGDYILFIAVDPDGRRLPRRKPGRG
ncbi:MAG: hypothetical protein IPG61_15805 [bacterium]|nr:hypothetical protein [bacterium]